MLKVGAGAEGGQIEEGKAVEPEVRLVLDAPDRDALHAARKAAVAAAIAANVAARKAARKPLDAALTTAKAAAEAQATTTTATVTAARDAALTKHAVTAADFVDVGYDAVQGHLVCSRAPRLAGAPPVERKRIALTDADADAFAASYALSCAASHDAFDLMRQVEAYKVAHPELFAGSVGEPPPVDPVYEGLKVALDAKQAIVQSEQAKQGAITAKAIAGETGWTYYRTEIATGEIVCGDNPNLAK